MIQLAGAAKSVPTTTTDWPSRCGQPHRQREQPGSLSLRRGPIRPGQGIGGQGPAVLSDDDYVGAIISKLRAQLSLHIDVEVHHRGGDGRGNDHGQQRGSGATAAEHGGAQKHASEHGYGRRNVRRLGAAVGDLLRSEERAGTSARSSFTSQCEHGIELYGAANRGSASSKGHKDGDGQDDWEEHGLNRDLRVENRPADLAGQQRSGGEPGNAAEPAPAAAPPQRRARRPRDLPAPSAFIRPTSTRRS